ncbi:hypothetical protein GS929_00525 [Rhodococcus hoagii]|nr:hypothetical protein [Prescottella equi]
MLSAGIIDQAVSAELLSVDAAQAAVSPVGPRRSPARSALVEYLPDGQFRLVRTGKVWTVEELIIGDEWEQQGGHHQCKRDALAYIARVKNRRSSCAVSPTPPRPDPRASSSLFVAGWRGPSA